MNLPVQGDGFPTAGGILSSRRRDRSRSNNGRLQALRERVLRNDLALLARSFRHGALDHDRDTACLSRRSTGSI
jgi:hypothetical protein